MNNPIQTCPFVLAKICPTRKKSGADKNFYPNFKSGHYIFHISIVRTRISPRPNCPTRKNLGIGHQFLVRIFTLFDFSDPNLTRIRIFASANAH